MKGQYITIESVFFFAIGVTMCIFVFFIFLNMSEILRKDNMKNQLEKTGDFLRSSIVNVFTVSNSTNSTIAVNVEIPQQISGCIYQITIDKDMIINCTENGIGKVLNLYGIETTIRNRILYSSDGKVKIICDSKKVELI